MTTFDRSRFERSVVTLVGHNIASRGCGTSSHDCGICSRSCGSPVARVFTKVHPLQSNQSYCCQMLGVAWPTQVVYLFESAISSSLFPIISKKCNALHIFTPNLWLSKSKYDPLIQKINSVSTSKIANLAHPCIYLVSSISLFLDQLIQVQDPTCLTNLQPFPLFTHYPTPSTIVADGSTNLLVALELSIWLLCSHYLMLIFFLTLSDKAS